jgi:hypothetical protein
MTAHALTSDLTYTCSHSATATVPGTGRLRIDDKPVVTHANMLATKVANCPNKDPNQSQKPCTKCVEASSGTKLRVDGELVVLDDFTSKTDSLPAPPGGHITASSAHSRLRSV